MATQVKPVPAGFHTVTPYLVVDGAEKVIRFMKEAFGAQPVFEPMMQPNGKVMHAEFKIGRFRRDDFRLLGACTSNIHHAVSLRTQRRCSLSEGA